MPSPFPGMDPYLEAHWRDVHARLIVYTSDVLHDLLPLTLRARVRERTLLDPYVLEDLVFRGPEKRQTDASAIAQPLVVDAEPEPVTEPFLEIVDGERDNRVVTVIEFLSPNDKAPGPDREQYLHKQREVCSSDANLVEIDLNRFGVHTLAFPLAHLKRQFRTQYMACVRRAVGRGMAEVYPLPLSNRLRMIRVPLGPNEDDLALDLQSLVEKCYRNGGCDGTLNYAAEPVPPLLGADRDWADDWLRKTGLRPRKKSPRRKGTGRSKKR